MTIDTRDFGNIEISEDGILELVQPILGFEGQKKFVILYDDEMGDAMAWLQSTEEKDTCFIIMDPGCLIGNYTPKIPEEALKELSLKEEEAVFRCLLVVPPDINDASINLKSPLIINPAKKLASQIVLEENLPVCARFADLREV